MAKTPKIKYNINKKTSLKKRNTKRNTKKRKKKRKIIGSTMSILNITDGLSQHNFYLDIINIYNDVYKNEIPLSHEDGKGISIIIRNNDNNQDLPIALLRIYRSTDSNDIGEIADVYVNEEFRGKLSPLGIKWSHLILDIGLKEAKKKLNIIWLWTTEDNFPAIKLYKFFKFKEFKNLKLSETIKAKHRWIGEGNIVFFIKEI